MSDHAPKICVVGSGHIGLPLADQGRVVVTGRVDDVRPYFDAAFEGISAVARRDLLVAAGPKAFSRAVVTLLRDPAVRERYTAAGRTCVESNHNWSRFLQRLKDLVVGGGQLAAAVTRPSSH